MIMNPRVFIVALVLIAAIGGERISRHPYYCGPTHKIEKIVSNDHFFK